MKNFGYKILEGKSFEEGQYSVASIKISDAYPIMEWRNKQVDALRQKKTLTEKDQEHYFKNKVEKEYNKRNPDPLLVRFTQNEKLIGYGGLVHIDWELKIAELSFLLESTRANDQGVYVADFTIFLSLIKRVAFDHLHFHKISTESYAHRSFHVKTIEKCGFHREGVFREHTLVDGRWVDAIVCSCLRTEYLSLL